ncbi:MAG: exodeoxyribonuclease VII small subunit [Lentimonas sp.]|jgi:exodeoxyribonuclease VII small subunit
MTKNSNIEKLTFEEALKQLEEIAQKLGNGKADLDEMVGLYEKGIALKEYCNKKLADAKMKVEKITVN